MKAKFFALVALVLGLAACQNEPEGLDVNVGGEQAVTINVTVPETETRAGGLNSALGVFDNGVLDGAATMRYILKIYDAAGVASHDRQVAYSDGKKVAFDVRLVPDRDYTFVVWADVVTAEADVDNHYDTSDLTNVTLKGEWVAMDETRDAFTTTELIEDFNGQSDITLNLKRPFAKLRVVSTDTEFLNHLNITPVAATLEYTTEYRPAFNAVKGTYAAAGTEKKTHEYTIASYNEDVANGADRTLFTDYIFADNDIVKFNLAVYEDAAKTKLIVSDGYQTDINVKRNHLTTIKGNLLTDGKGFEVTVVDGFDGYITEGGDEADKENIVDLLKANEEVIEVTLTEDVELSGQFTFGGADTKSITINGTAYTRAAERPVITLKSSYNYYFRAVNPEAKLYLNDVDIVIVDGNNADTWDVDDLLFDIDVEANNVQFNGAVALDGCRTAKFDGCSFNETRDYYAMWICPEFNKNVTIANSEFVSPRGIKIDDQYIDENGGTVIKTTLNVNNTSFKTDKKAAILVKSSAGADITLENVNINEVAADPINAVWVDEDAKQYADLVTVKGGSKVIEGTPASDVTLVKNAEELTNALATVKADAVIALADGLYEGGFHINKGLTLKAVNQNGAKINGKVGITGGGVVNIEGIEFSNNYTGSLVTDKGHVDNHTGKFCIGLYCAYVNVKDCTFNLYDTGGVYYYSFNHPEFCTIKNCTFNCNGFRPIYSKVNVEIDGCTFVDQYRYSVQIYGNKNNGLETVKFTNNTIINPAVTSGKPYAAGVQISNGYDLNNVAFTIEGNTLQSTKFNDLKFAYDYQQSGENLVEMNTCTLNGEAIVDAQCVVIPSDTKVKEVLDGILVPAVVDGAYQINNVEEFMYINERGMGDVTGLTFLADIDLEGREINPILKDGIVVKGNNKTISNFSITNKTQAALFGDTNNFNISDLTIAGATFSAKNVDGEDSAAAFIGFMEAHSAKDHKLTNCHVVGCNIGSAKYVGGLVAYKDGNTSAVEIINCSVTGSNIKSLYTEDNGVNYKGHCGGVIGYFATSTVITNCTVTGNTFEVQGPRCGAFIGSANCDIVVSGTCKENTGVAGVCGTINKITDWSNVVTE